MTTKRHWIYNYIKQKVKQQILKLDKSEPVAVFAW